MSNPGGLLRSGARTALRGLAAVTAGALGALIRRPWSAEAARRVLARRGFHLLAQHYYLPIPDVEELGDAFWFSSSELVGVVIDEAAALALLEEVVKPHLAEFRASFPLHPEPGRPGFFLINGNYMAVDAHVYHAMIRHFRPRHIVEIGGGNSTLLAAATVRAKHADGGRRSEVTVIEPFPGPGLEAALEGVGTLAQSKVQDVSFELFTGLGANDILFIDSSHVLRSGGDVQLEYLEILPRLAPGVLVHVHDISLPRPYPKVYFEQQLYWNEQYLLQAFLAFNSRFEVMWPGALMAERYPQRIGEVFPEVALMRQQFPHSTPTAFWMRVRS